MADAGSNAKLESLAYVHLADTQDRFGDVKAAAQSYQRALALDAEIGDVHGLALDWFNYGQFLRRHGIEDDLTFACLLHAEQLLRTTGGPEFDTAQKMRREVEAKLGPKAAASQKSCSSYWPAPAASPPIRSDGFLVGSPRLARVRRRRHTVRDNVRRISMKTKGGTLVGRHTNGRARIALNYGKTNC